MDVRPFGLKAGLNVKHNPDSVTVDLISSDGQSSPIHWHLFFRTTNKIQRHFHNTQFKVITWSFISVMCRIWSIQKTYENRKWCSFGPAIKTVSFMRISPVKDGMCKTTSESDTKCGRIMLWQYIYIACQGRLAKPTARLGYNLEIKKPIKRWDIITHPLNQVLFR